MWSAVQPSPSLSVHGRGDQGRARTAARLAYGGEGRRARDGPQQVTPALSTPSRGTACPPHRVAAANRLCAANASSTSLGRSSAAGACARCTDAGTPSGRNVLTMCEK
eukprot:6214471-Pleurochrysis_carterae.AAC.6